MLHLIFIPDAWVVSRKPYANWREIQGQFEDYLTSLEFTDEEDLLEWWQEEYSGPIPAALLAFLASGQQECTLR